MISRKSVLILVVAASIAPAGSAFAVVGRPATPISYAGVARRTTARAAAVTPGPATVAAPVATAAVAAAVVTPGLGAPGVGIAPGPGVSPVNMGGPVNRVGIR